MKKPYFALMLLAAAIVIGWGSGADATTIEMELTLNPFYAGLLDFYDYQAASDELTQHPNQFTHLNSEVIPTGMALANVLGYPNGRAMIGQFPHFEFGVSAGVAVYQLFRYEDYNKDNPEIPGGGVNGAFHFGTGIDDRMDIMFKIFILGSYYRYDKTFSQEADDRSYSMQGTDNSIYSFGVKTRYNLIMPSARSLFSFGGINANIAFDYMSARFAARGSYRTKQTVTMTIADPGFDDTEIPVELEGTVTGTTSIQWHLFSITPEVLAYFDVFYFISVYSGLSVSINRGAVTFEADAEGELHNTAPIYLPSAPATPIVATGENIATGRLHADSSMTPNIILPRFIFGLEFDFWAFKLQVEASSVLTSPTDSFTAQIGVRTEF